MSMSKGFCLSLCAFNFAASKMNIISLKKNIVDTELKAVTTCKHQTVFTYYMCVHNILKTWLFPVNNSGIVTKKEFTIIG